MPRMPRTTDMPRGVLRPVSLALLCAALALPVFPAQAAGDAPAAPRPGAAAAKTTVLTGKVVTTVTRGVPLPFSGVVDAVLVKPGDPVQQGSPLMRYTLYEEARRDLQREVNNGPSTEGLKGQTLDLERNLAEITAQRNKARQLASSGLGSQQASSRLEADVKSVERRIELLRSTIAKAENNFFIRLKELRGYFGQEIKEGMTLPHTLILTSPIDGYVLSLEATLNPGNLLGAGSAPIRVGQLNPVLVQVPVYEAEVSGIHEGDQVEVEIPSLGNRKFMGKVNEISWVSNDMNVANPSYYTVEVTVPNPDLELKPGFKAVVRFRGDG